MYYEWKGSVFCVWLVSLVPLRFHSCVNLLKYLLGPRIHHGFKIKSKDSVSVQTYMLLSHDACMQAVCAESCDEI